MLSGGVEVASAYVTLMPSMKGFQGELDKQLGGITGKAGEKGAKKYGSGFTDGIKKWAKRGAVAGAAAAGAAVGAAMWGGFRSAMGRQNTERVLTGLYASADTAADMMQRISDVARKSPIQASAYRSAAETLAYLSIEGEQAENILRNLGASVVTAGGGAVELERATDALTRMQNAGVVQLDTLNQLSQAGVPVYSGLAEHFGVAQEEIRGMVSEGVVGMEDVLSVAENATGEWFQKQVAASDEVSKTFSNQWEVAKDAIAGSVGTIILPLLDRLAPGMEWFANNAPEAILAFGEAVEGALDWLGQFIGDLGVGEATSAALGDALDQVWSVLKDTGESITGALVPAVGRLVDGFIEGEGAGGALRSAFEAVSGAATATWDVFTEYVLPVLEDVWDFIVNTLWPDIVGAFEDYIIPAVSAVAEAFAEYWEGAALPVMEELWKFIRDILWPFIEDFYENGIKPTFKGIADVIEWTWTNIIRPALDNFIDMMGSVRGSFSRAVSGIESAWFKLRQIVAKPIVAVIEFVNEGIIGSLNKVLDWAGVGTIGTIPISDSLRNAAMGYGARKYNPGSLGGGTATREVAMAGGGVLPGFSPGKDDYFFAGKDFNLALAGGEAIMRPEWTRAVGPGFVDSMNAAARTGGVEGVRKAMGFADGGIFGGIGQMVTFVTDLARKPFNAVKDWISGGLENLSGNPLYEFAVGTVSKVASLIKDKVAGIFENPFGAGADGAGYGGPLGWAPGVPNGIWPMIWKAVKSVAPEATMTSNFRPGAITASGVRSLHGMGRAIDIVSANMAETFLKVRNLMPWSQLFYTPMGALQKGYRDWRVARDHWDHIHLGYDKGGIFPNLYDKGGIIPPGLSLVANKTGKPEAVLNDEQWDALTANGGGGDTYNLYGVPMDQADKVAGEILYQNRRTKRGKYARRR